MAFQPGDTLRFWAFYTAAGVAKTGLTDVTANTRGPGGALSTGAAATEDADGWYFIDVALASGAAVGSYRAKFSTADTTVDQKEMPGLLFAGVGDAGTLTPAGQADLNNYLGTELTPLIAVDGMRQEWDDMTEPDPDNPGKRRYTTPSLVNSPAGAGGGASAADVWAYTPRSLTDKDGFTLSAPGVAAIWNALLTGITTAGSIGKKLKDWALGTDNRALISADAHTAGATVAGVSGNVTVGGYATGQDPATLLLATPANKLATDATGRVTVGSNGDKTGYSLATPAPTAAQVAAAILANPNNLLATDASGQVTTANPATSSSGPTPADFWAYLESAASVPGSMARVLADRLNTIIAKTDNLPVTPADESTGTAIQAVTDKLDELIQGTTPADRQLTAKALELASTGTGGGGGTITGYAVGQAPEERLAADLAFMKGLLGQWKRIKNIVTGTDGKVIGFDIFLYDNETSWAANGSTGVIATLQTTATYDGSGFLTTESTHPV